MLPVLTNHLTQLGIPTRMAEVYVFLTERGETGARDVAETFDLTRSTAHDTLCDLVRYGFATSFRRGRERRFVMESPDNIHHALDAERRYAEHRVDVFHRIAPSLHALYTRGNRQTGIRYFVTQDDVREKQREFCASASMRLMDDAMMYGADYGVDQRTLVVTDATSISGHGVRAISHALISMSGQMFIADDRVLFLPGIEPCVAIEIQCRSIAGMCSAMFELAWRAAGEWGWAGKDES
jgi:hypothetical protein